MGMLIFFYDSKTAVGGERHSLILLVSVFLCALVGCFSPVLFMPYLRDFDDVYTVSYFVGEGLSRMSVVLPSAVSLIIPSVVQQRPACNISLTNTTKTVSPDASDLKFQYYFSFLTLVLVLLLVAFIVLRYSPFVRTNKKPRHSNSLARTREER